MLTDLTRILVATVLCFAACADSFGQPGDPFGGGVEPGPEEPAEAPARSAAAKLEHPVVSAIRDRNPTTPVQLMKAVEMLMDIEETDEAKKYLDKLLAARPTVEQLEQLQREFGTGTFMRLAQYEPLLPEGRNLAQAVLDAAYLSARDPKRIEQLIGQLSDPSLGIRSKALAELRRAEVAALPLMIRALADPARSAEHENLREALVQLGKVSVEPLIGMLEAPDEQARRQAINVLGKLEARRAILYLVGPYLSEDSPPAVRREAERAIQRIVGAVPDRPEALQFLYRRAREFYNGMSPRQVEPDGSVELWHWNPEAKTSLPVRYPVEDAALVESARTADQLSALDPDRVQYRRLFLASILQSDKLAEGLQRPLPRGQGTAHQLASSMGVDAVLDTLDFAVKTDHSPAVIGALEVLADLGDASLLYSKPGRPGPVALLLRHRDRRVQFAAAQAILQWDPNRAYPGASRLIDTLTHFAATVGQPRVVVGHPSIEQAQSVIGTFAEAGLAGETASTGRGLFRRAVSSPDVEVILISDAIDHPAMSELRQVLRKDPRTASLPVGLLSREENLRTARRLAEVDDLAIAVPWPRDDAEMAVIRSRLIDLAGVGFVGRDERLNYAFTALKALVEIASKRGTYSFYDIRRAEQAAILAFQLPELSDAAARLLGLIATTRSQVALVDFASQTSRPIEQRQAAAEAFAAAVARRRLLLTTGQIIRQYDRYNASATLDKPTQEVLGSILDTIEQKASEKAAQVESEADAVEEPTS